MTNRIQANGKTTVFYALNLRKQNDTELSRRGALGFTVSKNTILRFNAAHFSNSIYLIARKFSSQKKFDDINLLPTTNTLKLSSRPLNAWPKWDIRFVTMGSFQWLHVPISLCDLNSIAMVVSMADSYPFQTSIRRDESRKMGSTIRMYRK